MFRSSLARALVIVIPVAIAGAAVGTLEGEHSPPAMMEEIAVKGTVSSWKLFNDGTIVFRIKPFDSGSEGSKSLWFKMPATRNATTHAEIQVLMVLVRAGVGGEDPGLPVTVTGDLTSKEQGLDEQRPIQMKSIAVP